MTSLMEVLMKNVESYTISPVRPAGSFTSQILTALTEDDDELRDRAFPDWEADDEEIDADTIRDGILERIRDDILCELPSGYDVGCDPATGAPTLCWVGTPPPPG